MRGAGYNCASQVIRCEDAMAIAALKYEPKLKMFHATVHVTRVEEWCVEAESAEEARELLGSGGGHRTHIGDCMHVEIERVEDEAASAHIAPPLGH
jgi:uncharacterized protein with PIN domain